MGDRFSLPLPWTSLLVIIISWVGSGLVSVPVQAGLVPFTLHATTADVERRDLYHNTQRLQPVHEVELHYAHGSCSVQGCVILHRPPSIVG